MFFHRIASFVNIYLYRSLSQFSSSSSSLARRTLIKRFYKFKDFLSIINKGHGQRRKIGVIRDRLKKKKDGEDSRNANRVTYADEYIIMIITMNKNSV